MHDLQQTLNVIIDYIKGIWIKKRYVMIFSWLLCPLGFTYVFFMDDVYESKAKVYVDTRSVLQPLLKGLAIQNDPQQEIRMMARTLLSRSNVEMIARESDLDLQAQTEQQFEKIVTDLINDIRLRSAGRTNIYNISYRNTDAYTAQKVVQEALDLFVEGSLGNNRRDTDTAERFINEQIAEYETRLAEAEQRLSDFKRQYSDILPLQGSFYRNLESLTSELELTQLTIKQTLQQVESLKSQIVQARQRTDNLGVNEGESDFALKTRYDDRILALEEQLDRLKLRFTDKHPDVVETQMLLNSLESERQKEIDSFLALPQDGTVNTPVGSLNQELKLEISRLEGEVASLRVKETDTKRKIEKLEAKIDLVPQVEAEAKSLNRDYDITKVKYEQLLSRRESADLSRRADVSAEDLQFRIIEPPLVPSLPSGPNRIIFYTIVLILGFGAGIGVAFLISQLSPILVRAKQLDTLTNYPVLGTVTHLDIDAIKRSNRLRMFIFAISSGAIVAIYGMLIAVEIMNIDLIARLGL